MKIMNLSFERGQLYTYTNQDGVTKEFVFMDTEEDHQRIKDATTTTFHNAQPFDKVWSPIGGWGAVLSRDAVSVLVDFPFIDQKMRFSLEGRYVDLPFTKPVLFWRELSSPATHKGILKIRVARS